MFKVKSLGLICLSLFYVTRILYGGTFLNIDISYFLIIFSFLFFLSLAIIKRLNEIKKYKLRLNIYNVNDAINLTRVLHILNLLSISIFIESYKSILKMNVLQKLTTIIPK